MGREVAIKVVPVYFGGDEEDASLRRGVKNFTKKDPPKNDLEGCFFGLLLATFASFCFRMFYFPMKQIPLGESSDVAGVFWIVWNGV